MAKGDNKIYYCPFLILRGRILMEGRSVVSGALPN